MPASWGLEGEWLQGLRVDVDVSGLGSLELARLATEQVVILAVMDTSYWSAWPGPLAEWRANYTRVADDELLDLPIGFLADNRYFQLATRPLFELWDNEPLTVRLQAQASVEQIRLFAVYVTDSDIENGGFWQWIGNSYSCLYPSLLEGHRMLGLTWVADLVEDGVRQVFPDNNLPLNHDARLAALDLLRMTSDVEEVVDRLGQRDRAYYSHAGPAHSNEELLPSLCRWIDLHAGRFFTGAPPPGAGPPGQNRRRPGPATPP